MRRVTKIAVLLGCVAAMPVVAWADSVITAPPIGELPLHPGTGSVAIGPASDPLGRPDRTAFGTLHGLTPSETVGVWNGCAAGVQEACALTFQITGPCASSVSTTSTEPTCLTILNTIYRTTIPDLPTPNMSVDGAAISDANWRDRLALLAVSQNRPSTAVQCEQEAAARLVLDRILYLEGVATGRAASSEQVQAALDHQIKAYPSMSAADRKMVGIPAGGDPSTYYNSSAVRLAFYHMLTTGNMRNAVVGQLRGAAADSAIREWFKTVVAHHVVTVTGLGDFAVADSLPNGL
jgi:hypothetical protein